VTWAGPFAVGASFHCTGVVPTMTVGTQETDTATVTANGQTDNKQVTSSNPWNGATPTPAPAIAIVKGDANGNAGDTTATAPDLGFAPASVGLVYTVTNTGNEPLTNVTVTDQLVANGTVTGLSCDFSTLGGPATGTTWAGPFAPGKSFTCTAQLSGVAAGTDHEDIATVTGTGTVSGTSVTSSNPYYASADVVAPIVTKAATGGLAFTGADSETLFWAALGLLIAGTSLLLAAGRRRRA
jgi:LPXTG-motif cell wall-anchored protein